MDYETKPGWVPDYHAHGDLVVIDGVRSKDCPVSAITGFSQTMIDIASRGQVLKDVAPMFSDGASLPARMIDALEVITIEKLRTDNALTERGKPNAGQSTRDWG